MWRGGFLFFSAALSTLSSGCSRDAAPHGSSPPPAAPGAGALLLGERITAPIVPLGEVAKDPARYENHVMATTGKVTAVCQEMGCWMELQDASGKAHVRMHGHSFFVPKTASGHTARVQATVVTGGGGCGSEDCSDQQTTPAQATAKVELDATGVELD